MFFDEMVRLQDFKSGECLQRFFGPTTFIVNCGVSDIESF